MNKKRTAAIIGLILIGLLYMATFILAFIDSSFARSCLMAALFATIVVPAVLYGYITFMASRSGRRTNSKHQVLDQANSLKPPAPKNNVPVNTHHTCQEE